MKRVTFKSLIVKDFKGITQQDITFSDSVTAIFGTNYSGKTSLLDSIYWCLFGKSLLGDTRFGVVPITAKSATPTVEIVAYINGATHSLKRQLVGGSVNECSIDGAPMKLGEYEAWVETNVMPMDRFKLFSNPLFFATKTWQEQRQMFTSFFVEPTWGEVADAMAADNAVLGDGYLELIKTLAPEKIVERMKREIAELERTKDRNMAVADDLARKIANADTTDTAELTAERERLLAEWETVKQQTKAAQDARQRFEYAQNEAIAIKGRIEIEVTKAMRERLANIDACKAQLADLKAHHSALRRQWEDANKAIETVCPTCGQDIQAEKVAAVREAQSKRRMEIHAEGAPLNTQIDNLEAEIVQLDGADLPISPQQIALEEQLEEAQKRLKVIESEAMPEVPNIDGIRRRLDEIGQALAGAERLKADTAQRDTLVTEISKTAREIELKERVVKDTGQFILYQAKVTVEKVNAQFDKIKIELFEYQKNGVVKPTFKLLFNGVEYKDMSSTEKLITGLEINAYLKKALDVSVPTIIDNFESYQSIGFAELPHQSIVSIVDAEQGVLSVVGC